MISHIVKQQQRSPPVFFKRISDVHDEEYATALAESGGDQKYARSLRTTASDSGRLSLERCASHLDPSIVYHVHVHCLVPGGGLSADVSRWLSSRRTTPFTLVCCLRFSELNLCKLPATLCLLSLFPNLSGRSHGSSTQTCSPRLGKSA
jgi:hypothetical protein